MFIEIPVALHPLLADHFPQFLDQWATPWHLASSGCWPDPGSPVPGTSVPYPWRWDPDIGRSSAFREHLYLKDQAAWIPVSIWVRILAGSMWLRQRYYRIGCYFD